MPAAQAIFMSGSMFEERVMNFEFPFKELPAVLQGPRVERRRVLVGGSAYWGTMVEQGAEAGKLVRGFSAFFEQTAVVAGFFGHLIYSVFVGVVIVLRSFASQFRFDVVIGLAVAVCFTAALLLFSRKFVRIRRA